MAEPRLKTQPWLRVTVGSTQIEAVGPLAPPPDATLEVIQYGGTLRVRAGGLIPGGRAVLQLGAEDVVLRISDEGTLQYIEGNILGASAGRFDLALAYEGRDEGAGDEIPIAALAFRLKGTKINEEAFALLLAALDKVAGTLAADLAGGTQRRMNMGESPEAALHILDEIVAQLTEAAVWIRRRPLARRHSQAFAVASATPRATARDALWLTRHPAAAIRARCGGLQAAVRRTQVHDLNIDENRGVASVFLALEVRLRGVEKRLEEALGRVEAEREAWTARDAQGRDVPANLTREWGARRHRLERRQKRANDLIGDARRGRARTGLPPTLAPMPLRRTAQVETHPGYWGVFRAGERLRDMSLGTTQPVYAPMANLDILYETWCAVEMARALAEIAEVPLDEMLRLDRSGWFVSLPRGEIASFERNGIRVHLDYEPVIAPAARVETDATFIKFGGGRPWRPDLVLWIERDGVPLAAHIFDAKHRCDRSRDDLLPISAFNDVWLKYTDSIGWAATKVPAVLSTWILYPGLRDRPWYRSKGMASKAWPAQRPKGGAIALNPGRPGDPRVLTQIVNRLVTEAASAFGPSLVTDRALGSDAPGDPDASIYPA